MRIGSVVGLPPPCPHVFRTWSDIIQGAARGTLPPVDGPIEVDLGDWVLRLDGTVVETLHSSGVNARWHVNHVAVVAKPRRDGDLRIRIGIERMGQILEGSQIDVPPDRQGEVTALFETARSRRTRPAPA